jgi:hypothetical protein
VAKSTLKTQWCGNRKIGKRSSALGPNRERPSILTERKPSMPNIKKQVEFTPFRAECGLLIGRHASYPNRATITTRGSGAAHRSILTAHVAPSITKDQKRER